MRLSLLLVALSLPTVFACQNQVDDEPLIASSAAEKEQSIVGGIDVETCGFPTTVSLGGCTGTLIHPRSFSPPSIAATHSSPSLRVVKDAAFPGASNAKPFLNAVVLAMTPCSVCSKIPSPKSL